MSTNEEEITKSSSCVESIVESHCEQSYDNPITSCDASSDKETIVQNVDELIIATNADVENENVNDGNTSLLENDDNSNESSIKQRSTKISKIIDSESEEELITLHYDSGKENLDSESDSAKFQKNHKSKVNAICDSESSDENSGIKETRLNDSSSNTSNQEENVIEVKRKKILKKKRDRIKSNISKSDDSENESRIENKAKLNALCDSESSDEDNNDRNTSISPKTDKKTLKKPSRMSSKDASEQRKLIQSESQRMEREARISIPYHKPKQFTLKEFLNRKSLVKSIPTTHTSKKAAAALKMANDELITFAKQLEEREIESQEFFKSDDEEMKDAEDDMLKNDKSNEEKNSIIETNDNEKMDALEIVEEKSENTETNFCDKMIEIIPTISLEKEIEICQNDEPENTNEETEDLANISNIDSQKENFLSKTKKSLTDFPKDIPFLKGAPNTLIDFETGTILRNQTGVDQLLERFITNTKTSRSIDSHKEANTTFDSNHKECAKEPKPGAALLKLKGELAQKIAENRRARLLQKIEEQKKNIEEDQEEEEMEEELDSDYETEKQVERELNKEVKINENEEIVDNIDEKEDDEEIDGNSSSEESDKTICKSEEEENSDSSINTLKPDDHATKKKSRIISAFVDSDDEDNSTENATEKTVQTQKVQIDIPNEFSILTQNENDDLMELCSGRFETTQSTENVAPSQSSVPIFDKNSTLFEESQPVNDCDLMELCSGTFATQKPTIKSSNICSSSNENPSDALEDDNIVNFNELVYSSDEDENKTKENTNKAKKPNKQLQYSDDEDTEEIKEQDKKFEPTEESENESDVELDKEELNEEEAERYLDYDSEENEDDLKEKKKNRIKISEFLENEAELSESEWGSDDESETEIDKYDIELADSEKFDNKKIHQELERIHMRRVLDDDDREVKLIKNMLFVDEEDKAARERQFRWKNVDNTLTLDDQRTDENATLTQEGSDDETEENWRRMRHERELLLKTDENIITAEVTKIRNEENNITTEVTSAKKKIEVIKFNSSLDQTSSKMSPFIITKSTKTDKKTTRGSFLLRDTETLSRLASLTKSSDTTDSVEKSGNFVFSVLSPSVESEKNITKRTRNEDVEETSSQNKKQKINTEPEKKNSKKRLLDYLM